MSTHHDAFEIFNKHPTLREKLVGAYNAVTETLPFIARVAVTLYDPETMVLRSYLHSSCDDNPLVHYQALLDDAPSLKEIMKQGHPRVINNMLTFEHKNQEHLRRIGRQGFAASYTLPMFNNGEFFGFIFFNSFEKDVFTEKVLRELDSYGHIISLMVLNELSMLNVLPAAIKPTDNITRTRNPETGSHLDRMSRYSRIIAKEMAEKHELDDGYIQHVFMFAPLHDIGKIAIPDNILLKPGNLDEEELKIMKTHSRTGREMIDNIIDNFGLSNVDNISILRNIAEYHHEALNGTGYPDGRAGEDIPLEARIVAVADVFDALTSPRPYKEAWSNDIAFIMLRKISGEKLDHECVEALIAHRSEIEEIQELFKEDVYG
ncbi:MAG: HD domain-containing protein [Gammaproteobacteria bacterium]|nr:MAG: HD domain-containing protein [Gammaproteobacteria bacterium]